MIFGLGQEFRAFGRPVLVDLLDVGHPDIEEGARAVWVWWRGQGDGRFVVCRPATLVEDEPGIRHLHDYRVALDQHLASEYLLIEVSRASLVGDDQEMGQDETVLRRGKGIRDHLLTSS